MPQLGRLTMVPSTSTMRELREIGNVPARSAGSQQQTLQRYMNDLAGSLEGTDPSKSRIRLIRMTYSKLRLPDENGGGHSARTIAEQIDSKCWNRLRPWVWMCLLALEARGLVYRTYDDCHFLATNSELELDDPMVASVMNEAFSSSSAPMRDHEMSEADLSGAPEEGSRQTTRRVIVLGGRYQRRAASCGIDGMRLRECSGRVSQQIADMLWAQTLAGAKFACLHPQRDEHPQRSGKICSTEYSPSGEYLLSTSSTGRIQIFRSTTADCRLRDSQEAAMQVPEAFPIRDVASARQVDVAHWNPGNRNEVGASSRASGDILSFDMKRCGTVGDRNRNAPTTVYTNKAGQGQGGVMDFSFVPQLSMVVAGMTVGRALLWDVRAPRSPKMTLRPRGESGGLCFTQVLSSGHTLVGASERGCVSVWDLRAVRAGMNVKSLGGRDDGTVCSLDIDAQLPVINADGELCRGSLGDAEASAPRAYALEPGREVQLGFALGRNCVGVLNLLSRTVTHVHLQKEPPGSAWGTDVGKRRLAWLAPTPRRSTLVHAAGDELTLMHTSTCKQPRERAWDEISQLEPTTVSAQVCALAAHPSDPTLALGVGGGLWAMSFGYARAAPRA